MCSSDLRVKMTGHQNYSTLQVSYDNYESIDYVDPREYSRKVTRLAAVVAAVVCMFFAGRVYEGETIGYTHEEVMDISAKCGGGEFIGGCVTCKTCAPYEFANGGCSFFKDRFCTFCEPIRHCKREKILCQTREDQICLECDCDDPVGNWTDIDLDDYLKYEMYDREEYKAISQEQATYSCYWNEQCLPCKVCPLGEYQTKQCTQNEETQCRRCTDCTVDQWVEIPCMYKSDTVCQDCTHFYGSKFFTGPLGPGDDRWTSQKCYRFESTGPLYPGSDAIASDCARRDGHQFYKEECMEFSNSVLEDCYLCADDRTCEAMGGEYIREDCVYGTTGQVGITTLCNKCTNADEMPGYFEHKRCFSTGHEDAEWSLCDTCRDGEYEHTACRLSTQTICPICYPVNGCAPEDTVCSIGRAEDDNDSECMGTPQSNTEDNPLKEAPWFKCQDGYSGAQCHYMQSHADCGVGAGYRERTAKTGKFRGRTNDQFVAWCMMLCDEFPDCTGFEINDFGDSDEFNTETRLTKPNSLCSMKNMEFGSVITPSDFGKECFANTRRQLETKWRDTLEGAGMKIPKPMWYGGVGQPGYAPLPLAYWVLDAGTNSIAAQDRPTNRQYDNIGPKDPLTGLFAQVSSTQFEAVFAREATCGYPNLPEDTPESRPPPGIAAYGLDANALQLAQQKKCDEDCKPHTPSNDNVTPPVLP